MLPILKFSVDWWNTLHQPSTGLGSTLDPSMRIPLYWMAGGFTLMFFAMHLKGMRNEILRRRVKALRMSQVERAQAGGSDTIAAPAE